MTVNADDANSIIGQPVRLLCPENVRTPYVIRVRFPRVIWSEEQARPRYGSGVEVKRGRGSHAKDRNDETGMIAPVDCENKFRSAKLLLIDLALMKRRQFVA